MKELKNWLVFVSALMVPAAICWHFKISLEEFALICLMLTPICAILAKVICKYMGRDK